MGGFLWYFGWCMVVSISGIGVNWGTQSTHPLPPDTVVKQLRGNGIQKVKLFDGDSDTLNALGKSGIEVMVGIPNDLLLTMASIVKAAEKWVAKNVSSHISGSAVNIRFSMSFSWEFGQKSEMRKQVIQVDLVLFDFLLFHSPPLNKLFKHHRMDGLKIDHPND